MLEIFIPMGVELRRIDKDDSFYDKLNQFIVGLDCEIYIIFFVSFVSGKWVIQNTKFFSDCEMFF